MKGHIQGDTINSKGPGPSVRCDAAMRPESGVLACILLIELFPLTLLIEAGNQP